MRTRRFTLMCIMLSCIAICASSYYISSSSTQKVEQKQKKRPNRKRLQNTLWETAYDTLTVLHNAIERYARSITRVEAITEAHRYGEYVYKIEHDRYTVMQYLEEVITGDPPLSREALEQRIQHVNGIQLKWNI